MAVTPSPTVDVLRAIRLMLQEQDHWFRPKDFATNRRHTGNDRIALPKACGTNDTTRLRERLLYWKLVETKQDPPVDNRGRKMKKPIVSVRLRRDPEGVRRIGAYLWAAHGFDAIGSLPGLTRKDYAELEGKRFLAALLEWENVQGSLLEARAEAGDDALYTEYRYHLARATLLLTRPGYAERFEKEAAALQTPQQIQAYLKKAVLDHIMLKRSRELPRKGAGIKPSRSNPPGRTWGVTAESLPGFRGEAAEPAEPAYMEGALWDGPENGRP